MLKNATKTAIRCYSTEFKVLKDSQEIRAALSQPSWSLRDLLEQAKVKFDKTEVSDEKVLKTLALSGFRTNIPPEKFNLIKDALKQQMVLVNHIYNENHVICPESSNDSVFRLIASDHQHQKPLSLKQLLAQIDDLPNQIDPEKGENGFNINDLDPKNKTYFKVRLNKHEDKDWVKN